VRPTDAITAQRNRDLDGDRRSTRAGGKRQVTLIPAEHLAMIANRLHRAAVPPDRLRRILVGAGVNPLAFTGQPVRIGIAVLPGTGSDPPCPPIEAALDPGGDQAVRGPGGISAEILETGPIVVGDALAARAEDGSPSAAEARR
jgi:MOSC domain-containing protein YiiM